MTATTPVVFLFDANNAGKEGEFWYGGVFDPAFLRALENADPSGLTSSLVRRGDILVWNLCDEVTAVSRSERSSSHQRSVDADLLRTVIWDLVDALASQWHTIDPNSFAMSLVHSSVHCISLPTFPTMFRVPVDNALQPLQGYLGAIEVDLGNPIQRQLFLDWLVGDSIISGGSVTLERDYEGHVQTLFEGAEEFKPNGLAIVEYDKLRPSAPKPPTLPMSARGTLSHERLLGKQDYSLHQRVLDELVKSSMRGGPAFEFSRLPESPGRLDAELSEAKFIRYLLDPQHKEGGGKAKFFETALGIRADDWRFLAAQLYDGLKTAELAELRVESSTWGFGAKFNASISVRGLNGNVAVIETVWIMKPGQIPALVTALPGDKELAREPLAPVVISRDLEGDERWSALFDAAHQAGLSAAKSCVPTPMHIQGYGTEFEGACGSASIWFRDGRASFAQWLIKAGHAKRAYPKGVRVLAAVDSQSLDRSTAYARAFALVLHQNGIQSEVRERID